MYLKVDIQYQLFNFIKDRQNPKNKYLKCQLISKCGIIISVPSSNSCVIYKRKVWLKVETFTVEKWSSYEQMIQTIIHVNQQMAL